MPLFEEHWDENRHDGTFDPDKARYLEFETHNALRVYTARRDGVLIGYSAVYIVPSLWHKGEWEATQHSLFVRPAYRGRTSIKLIRYTEDQLWAERVSIFHQHVHLGRPDQKLFEKLGYTAVHVELEKHL